MTILLDTCALLWFTEDSPKLSGHARASIEDISNTLTYSIASVWEMAIKLGLGKLTMSCPLFPDFANTLDAHGFQRLSISYRHASEVAGLPRHHADPFDRLLIAQALVESLPIASRDRAFDQYPVSRIW